jgi:5-methylcytosine-specific restriction protein A
MALRMLRPTLATLDTRAARPAPKTADPFYQSQAWRELVDKIKAARGARCEQCRRDRCRIFGDHIVERKDGGAELDPDNVRLLCGSCHTAKTVAARAARMARPSRPSSTS